MAVTAVPPKARMTSGRAVGARGAALSAARTRPLASMRTDDDRSDLRLDDGHGSTRAASGNHRAPQPGNLFSGQSVAENRDRNAREFSDRNAVVQELGGTERSGTYASWRVESSTRLVRTQRDPQSTRIMTVILTSPDTCKLDVVDTLKPGFSRGVHLQSSPIHLC